MARNYIQAGEVITVTPTAAVKSGELFALGQLVGVIAADAPADGEAELILTGVFALPKATGAITAGALLYLDAEHGSVTTTAGTNAVVGHAIEAAASDAAEAIVRLWR